MQLFLQISVIFALPTILMTIYGFIVILYFTQESQEHVNTYAQSIYEQQINYSKIMNNAIQFQLSQQVQRKSWSIQLMNQFSLKVIEGEVIMNKNYKPIFLNTERTYANKDDPAAIYLFKRNKLGVVNVRTWHHYENLYVNEFDIIGQDHLRNSTYSDLLWRMFEYDNILLSSSSERYLKFNSIYHVFDHNSMGYLTATNTTFQKFNDPKGCTTGRNRFNGKCRYWYVNTTVEDSMILYPPDLFFSDQGNPFLASVLCQKLLRHNKTLHWVKCTSLNLQKMQSFFANMGNFSTYTMVIDPRNYTVMFHTTVPQQRAIANTLGTVELDSLQDQKQALLFKDNIKQNYGKWVISETDSVQTDEILLPNYQKTFTYFRNGSEALAICNPVIIIDKIKQKNTRILSENLDLQNQITDKNHQKNNAKLQNDQLQINDEVFFNQQNLMQDLADTNDFDQKEKRKLEKRETTNKPYQQSQKIVTSNSKKYRLEASYLLIDVLSSDELKKFSIQILNDLDYHSKLTYIIIFSVLTILVLFILYQSVCITHMIQFPIWHLTHFLKKINDSGDINRFNTVNRAFSINVESFFYSEDMKILFISFKNMFQMLTFTNQSYFSNDSCTTLLNFNKQIIHFEKFKNYRALGVCHNNIANILFNLERYIEALQHYQSAIVYSKLELGLFSKDFSRDGDDEKPDDVRMFQSKQPSEATNTQYAKQGDQVRIPSIFNRKSSTQAQTNPKSCQNYATNHDQPDKENKLIQSNFLNQSICLPQNQTIIQNLQASIVNKPENLNNLSFAISSAQQLQNNLEPGSKGNIFKQKKKILNQQSFNQNNGLNDKTQQQGTNKSQNNNIYYNNNNNDSHLQSNFNLVQNSDKNNKSDEKGSSIPSEEEELQIVGFLLQQTREYHQLIFNLYHRKMNYLKCFINFLNQKQSSFSQFLWEEAEVLAQELINLAKYFPKKNGRNIIVYSYLSLIQIKQQKWKEAEESCLIAKEYVMKTYEYENHLQEIQNNDHFNKGEDLYTQIFQELSEDNLCNDEELYNFFSELPSQSQPSKQFLENIRINKAISLVQNYPNKNLNQSQVKRNTFKKYSYKDSINVQTFNEMKELFQKQNQPSNQQSENNTDTKKRNSQPQPHTSNKYLPMQSMSVKQSEDNMHLNDKTHSNRPQQKTQIEGINNMHNTPMQQSTNNSKLINILLNQRIMQYKNQKQILQFLGNSQSIQNKPEQNFNLNYNFQNENHFNSNFNSMNGFIQQSLNLQTYNNNNNNSNNNNNNNNNQDYQKQIQFSASKPINNLYFNNNIMQASPLQNKNYASSQINSTSGTPLKDKEQQNVNQYYKSVNEVIQEEEQGHQDQQQESQISEELYQAKKAKIKQINQLDQILFRADFRKPQTKINQSNLIINSADNSFNHSNHEDNNQIISNQQLFSGQKIIDDYNNTIELQPIKQNKQDVKMINSDQQYHNQFSNIQSNNQSISELQHGPIQNLFNQSIQNNLSYYQKNKKSQAFSRAAQNNNVENKASKVKNTQSVKDLQNYEYPPCVLHAILINQNRLLEAAYKITEYLEQSYQYLPHYNFRILYQLQLIFSKFQIHSYQLSELLKVYTKQIYQRVGIIAACSQEKNKKNSYYFCKDLMKDILKDEEDTFGLLTYQDQLFDLQISNISFITLNKNIDILKQTLKQIFFSNYHEIQDTKYISQQQLIKSRNYIQDKVSPFTTNSRRFSKRTNKSQSNVPANINEKQNLDLDEITNQLSSQEDTSFLSLDRSFAKNCSHQWQTLQNQNNNNYHHESVNLSVNNSPNLTLFNTQPQQIQNKQQRSNTVGNIKKVNNQYQNYQSPNRQDNKLSIGFSPAVKTQQLYSQNSPDQIIQNVVNTEEIKKNTTQISKKSEEAQLFEKQLNPQEIFHIGVRKALTNFVPKEQLEQIINGKQYLRHQNKYSSFIISKPNQNQQTVSSDNNENQNQNKYSYLYKQFQEATNSYYKEKIHKKYLIFITDQSNVEKNGAYYQLCEILYYLDIQLLILQFNKNESTDEQSKHSQEFINNKCVIQYFYSSKKLLQYLYNQRSDYQSNLIPLAVEHFQTVFLFVFIF